MLGSTSRVSLDGAVLGGLEGVTLRLQASDEQARITALQDALKYGQEGLELVFGIMQGRGSITPPLQQSAWELLWMMATKEGRQELLDYLPKFTFDVVTVSTTGHRVSAQTSTL